MQRSRGGFVEHPSLTLVAQQSVTKIITLAVVNLVTPKAGAKHELLFNEPATTHKTTYSKSLRRGTLVQKR